jgi:hypothetical protein
MEWFPVSFLFEKRSIFKRLFTRSGKKELFGVGGTVRDKIGFEKKGKTKLVPKRKRPKKRYGDLIARTPLKRR